MITSKSFDLLEIEEILETTKVLLLNQNKISDIFYYYKHNIDV